MTIGATASIDALLEAPSRATTFSRSTSSRYCATVFTGLCSSSRETRTSLRPLIPPLALISSIAISAPRLISTPTNDSGPLSAPAKPILIGPAPEPRRSAQRAATTAAQAVSACSSVIATSILFLGTHLVPVALPVDFARACCGAQASGGFLFAHGRAASNAAAAHRMSVSPSALTRLQAHRQSPPGEPAGNEAAGNPHRLNG